MESVQLALARQDVKERECAIIVDAGRVTATARADGDQITEGERAAHFVASGFVTRRSSGY
jgi:hypothetical protein